MYKESLYAKTEQILERVETNPIFKDFYLAGGTALALQLGHRKSIDLDWFSPEFPKNDLIKQSLADFVPLVIHETHGTVDMVINDVKLSFLEYKYPLLKELVSFEDIKMASVIDIACMKISAISSRGSKKDFVDLYAIMKEIPLEGVLNAFDEKYIGVQYQKLHILKSLVYFVDAEEDPDPDYLEEIDWAKVKKTITAEVKKII
jgi:hypothetical protein